MSSPPILRRRGGRVLSGVGSQDLSHTFWIGMELTAQEDVWAPGVGLGIYEYAGTNNTGLAASGRSERQWGTDLRMRFRLGTSKWADANFNCVKRRRENSRLLHDKGRVKGTPEQMYARVDASKSYFASESQCTRKSRETPVAPADAPPPNIEGKLCLHADPLSLENTWARGGTVTSSRFLDDTPAAGQRRHQSIERSLSLRTPLRVEPKPVTRSHRHFEQMYRRPGERSCCGRRKTAHTVYFVAKGVLA